MTAPRLRFLPFEGAAVFSAKQTMGTVLVGMLGVPSLFGQEGHSASASAQASATIVSPSTFAKLDGYDPASETRLSGVVEQAKGGRLLLRMVFGVVAIEVGPAIEKLALHAGQQLQVTVSKVMKGGSQRLIAREVRTDGRLVEFRNAQGIPLEQTPG